MLSKNKIKYLRSLKLKKFRQKYNNFSVEGEKIIEELLHSENAKIESIIATSDWQKQHFNETLSQSVDFEIATENDLKKISNLTSASSVFAVVQKFETTWNDELVKNNFSLYLDDIQDPGNLGTILRIADWFGFPFVFCSEKCADIYNPKTLQSSMGAFLRVKIMTVPFEKLVARYSDLPIYGTVLDGKNIFEQKEYEKGIVVIGNEGKGISESVLEKITHRIFIPKGKNGGAESLNAAVATGIVCNILAHRSA